MSISYILDFSDRFKVTTSAYNNFFRRNWYKLDDIVFNGESQKISKVIGEFSASNCFIRKTITFSRRKKRV